ncbi:MAG TPA: hypothetical protein VGL22_19470 [Terracidiphilus sp.]|jgi:hypothetical protein
MQAIIQSRRINFKLLSIGAVWLGAALLEYAVMRQPGNAWFLPVDWQTRFASIPIQQISTEFPIFAQTIAASILGVWLLRCKRNGAFLVCGVCVGAELVYEVGQRSDFSAWLLPILPRVWPLDHVAECLGKGTFSFNHVMAIVLGGMIAYLVVVNTIPAKR